MMAPERIQRQRSKGWRMPPGAIYVGRPTVLGNPFHVGDVGRLSAPSDDGWFDGTDVTLTPDLCVILYRDVMSIRLTPPDPHDLPDDRAYIERWISRVSALRGHPLVCWCSLDRPCHADVLLELANR